MHAHDLYMESQRDEAIKTILSDTTGVSQAWLTSVGDKRGEGLPNRRGWTWYLRERVNLRELQHRAQIAETAMKSRAEARAEAKLAAATVPTLHELCCRLICDEDVYMSARTVLDILEFAKMWNVAQLQKRAEAFVAGAFPTLQEMHGTATLEQVLGDELHAKLVADQEEASQIRRRLSLVGQPVEKEAPPNALLEPIRTASDRDTWPYEQLKTGVAWPPGVGPNEREQWLSNEEFETVFGMPRERFVKLPTWKRATLRKDAELF